MCGRCPLQLEGHLCRYGCLHVPPSQPAEVEQASMMSSQVTGAQWGIHSLTLPLTLQHLLGS